MAPPVKEGAEETTLLHSRGEETTTTNAACALVVVDGPDAGLRVVFDGTGPQRVLVGQGPVCTVRLSDRSVSRRHLALAFCEQGLRLTDLESTNGTFLNGLRIVDAFLAGGEAIRIGATTLRVEALPAAPGLPIPEAGRFGRLIGASREMRRLYPLCERIARSTVPVVIEGETGTGKEVLAEALHDNGPRAKAPFVVFDCTANLPSVVESALFGHERGSFTGALATRKGVFELAHGGTLLIDEIGDLDLSLQPKLLRAIERGEVQRVGGERWIKVDTRVIAATRRDLDREVQEGRFRDDLFFRLAVARIELPPLRQRHGDIAVLARHFWRDLGSGDVELPPELLARFEASSWPGNARELRNAVARHLALGDLAGEEMPPFAASPSTIAELPSGGDPLEAILALDLPLVRARERLLREFESRYVARVLARYGGNLTRAAAASGIKRRYFQVLRARQGKPSTDE